MSCDSFSIIGTVSLTGCKFTLFGRLRWLLFCIRVILEPPNHLTIDPRLKHKNHITLAILYFRGGKGGGVSIGWFNRLHPTVLAFCELVKVQKASTMGWSQSNHIQFLYSPPSPIFEIVNCHLWINLCTFQKQPNPQHMHEAYSSQLYLHVCVCLLQPRPARIYLAMLQFQSQRRLDTTLQCHNRTDFLIKAWFNSGGRYLPITGGHACGTLNNTHRHPVQSAGPSGGVWWDLDKGKDPDSDRLVT